MESRRSPYRERFESPVVAEINSGRFDDHYSCTEVIGCGGFSEVKKGIHLKTKGDVACKFIKLSDYPGDKISLVEREVEIMSKLSHKNIACMKEYFKERNMFILVLEYFEGKELFNWITKSDYSYSEDDAAKIIRQTLEATAYLHKNNIAHRDIKPENLLYEPKSCVIKMIDFGLSKKYNRNSLLVSSVGTVDYCAPEVFSGKSYDNSVDVWSIGVICYVLLCGFVPWLGENSLEIKENIKNLNFDFPSPEWDDVSAEAKKFISDIFVLQNRPTANQCLLSDWILNKAPLLRVRRTESRDNIHKRIQTSRLTSTYTSYY